MNRFKDEWNQLKNVGWNKRKKKKPDLFVIEATNGNNPGIP